MSHCSSFFFGTHSFENKEKATLVLACVANFAFCLFVVPTWKKKTRFFFLFWNLTSFFWFCLRIIKIQKRASFIFQQKAFQNDRKKEGFLLVDATETKGFVFFSQLKASKTQKWCHFWQLFFSLLHAWAKTKKSCGDHLLFFVQKNTSNFSWLFEQFYFRQQNN